MNHQRKYGHFIRTGILTCLMLAVVTARAQTLDALTFGDAASEKAHGLMIGWGPVTPKALVDAGHGIYPSDPSITPPSDVVIGGLGESARRLLPRTPHADIYGGEMSFTMSVDPDRQNYFTIKLWGSDPSDGIWLILDVEGR